MLKVASQSDDYTTSTAPLQADVDYFQPVSYHLSSHQAKIAANTLDSRTCKHIVELTRHAVDYGQNQNQNQPALRLAQMYQNLIKLPVRCGITCHTHPSKPPSSPALASLLTGPCASQSLPTSPTSSCYSQDDVEYSVHTIQDPPASEHADSVPTAEDDLRKHPALKNARRAGRSSHIRVKSIKAKTKPSANIEVLRCSVGSRRLLDQIGDDYKEKMCFGHVHARMPADLVRVCPIWGDEQKWWRKSKGGKGY
ncbi:hypothetical protein FB567DRAFT_605944 [Paraphoma chrysanthemicola]|uniref:Uncharacterized protein n=1 Tax=Paraphoma chrysanthemicola TaxID=798071 RepID=A0A8K0VW88_9PLEO|nr:hypothetical protein FB567DRAFT_605944 [Paraphoma chrysanthemicola]